MALTSGESAPASAQKPPKIDTDMGDEMEEDGGVADAVVVSEGHSEESED